MMNGTGRSLRAAAVITASLLTFGLHDCQAFMSRALLVRHVSPILAQPQQIASSVRPVKANPFQLGLRMKEDGTGEDKDNVDDASIEAFRALLEDNFGEKGEQNDDGEFDGYKFRDLIVEKWGVPYDIQIKREM
mmetsp:Transcript_38559/g.60127  ORF Transcript_38559/g.60127 Transcript_38559/m.60127 type:complete len:134 (-) Transcript_38559:685-1086(-)